jgi:hypothetical protein
VASDRRFKVGANLDGKLFGKEPEARLDRPFLWIQSGDAKTAEYTQGRDRLLHGLRDGGSLLTVRGSTHMSFTDGPSYLTSLGRRLAGGATVGSISVADMTAMTGDTISAFVGAALGVKGGRSLRCLRSPFEYPTRAPCCCAGGDGGFFGCDLARIRAATDAAVLRNPWCACGCEVV